MKTIAVVGTFDTKGPEHEYLANCIRRQGLQVLMVDVGGQGLPQCPVDFSREEVAAAAGLPPGAILNQPDRGAMVTAMATALPVLLARLVAEGRIDGVISMGGTGGTAIGTAGMRALPLGFPKLMVSTVAGGNVAPYVGIKDIVMFPSIVDVAGLNRISQGVFARAALAISGMVEANQTDPMVAESRPLVVASMFGNTTTCVDHARRILEEAGYEVLVFHATGVGGRMMEALIESGVVAGVLDVTTTEWADEWVGGILGAGTARLEAAARGGIPAVVTPGCLDMVNFGARDTVPAQFQDRRLYVHNPQITLMRTTPEECTELGRILAEKINLSVGKVSVLIPARGVSVISEEGGAFFDPEADQALFSSLRSHLRGDLPIEELDCAINDARFATRCAETLIAHMHAEATEAKPTLSSYGSVMEKDNLS